LWCDGGGELRYHTAPMMNGRRPGLLVAVLLCSILAAAPLTWAQTPVPGPAAGTDEGYRIGPEDLLSIVVWKNETLSRQVTVRPDGKISLPLVNDVQAAGLTAMQLREELTRKLSAFMPPPEVSVIVNEVRSFHISVLGEVQKPGRYDLRSTTTVLEAIALAGGFKDFASPNKIVVLRTIGKTSMRIPFNYKRVAAAGGGAENFELLPNDIILVP
jgi:polysaccharide biosynthesis/export protein